MMACEIPPGRHRFDTGGDVAPNSNRRSSVPEHVPSFSPKDAICLCKHLGTGGYFTICFISIKGGYSSVSCCGLFLQNRVKPEKADFINWELFDQKMIELREASLSLKLLANYDGIDSPMSLPDCGLFMQIHIFGNVVEK